LRTKHIPFDRWMVWAGLLLLTCWRGDAHAQVLFYDNFEQFPGATDLTSTNYTPASGPSSASVVTWVDNGSPTITVTNFLSSVWAFFDDSVLSNKNSYIGYLSLVQTDQPLELTWKMWIQATNSGKGAFLLSVPVQDPANPTIDYNPPLAFLDTGAIIGLTNGVSVETFIGSWGPLAGTVMTNTLMLDYPNGTFSYSLNGRTLATLPLGPYFTNVVGAITFTGIERDPGSLGNRFAISEVEAEVQAANATVQLTITRLGANVILTWPTNYTGFTLQSTTNLGSSALWTTNSQAAMVAKGQYAVTDAISGTQKFYRLTQ
jgi:hypothetical protein